MDNIIVDYGIKPAKLNWSQDYSSVENYRLDVHRMRLPETAEPGRRLIAHNYRWNLLLKLIHKYIQSKGEEVS